MQPKSTVLRSRWLVSVDQTVGTVQNATVHIDNGVITYAGATADAPPLPHQASVVDLADHIVLPGLVNAHTHLPMTLLRGLADDLPLKRWLENHIFPAENALMSRSRVAAGASLAAAEMLLSGTTCCADGYFHEDAVLEAVAALGCRGIFAQGVMDFPAPGVPDVSTRFDVLERFLAQDAGNVLQQPGVFAHSLYTCSADTLKAAKQAADKADRRFFIHVAETAGERQMCKEKHDLTPVAYLNALGLLEEHTTLIHAVHVDEQDIDLMARAGCGVVVNTESNMKLASGVAPLPEFLRRGLPVGLGTDGAASNNDLDLLAEIGSTARLHKLIHEDPAVLSAEEAVELATIGGARALGLQHSIGSISAGKDADLVALRIDRPHAHPLYDPISHIAYSASAADVDLVMVRGRTLVQDRHLLTCDLDALMHQVRQCIDS